MESIKNKFLAASNIPEYIKRDYPLFVEFMDAYYSFLYTQGNPAEFISNVLNYSDIDNTYDSFIQYFKNELMKDLPINLATDTKSLLKNIKQLYITKGSEASYKLLFRIIYNKDVTFYTPSENIIKTSDGEWTQKFSICVRIPTSVQKSTILNIIDKNLYFNTPSGKLYARIQNVSMLYEPSYDGYNYYEFFIYNNLNDISRISQFLQNTSNVTTYIDGIFDNGELIHSISSIDILHAGNNFVVGNNFTFDQTYGIGGTGLVKRVYNTKIKAAEIINFGHGFYNSFQQIIYPITAPSIVPAKVSVTLVNKKITALSLISGGSGYTTTPIIKIIGNGYGAYATCTISGGSVNSITLVHGGDNYTIKPSVIFDDTAAVLLYNIDYIRKYPGYFNTSAGLLDDLNYIQDGDYYQKFSYELQIDELFESYRPIVKKILHPSGYKLFGSFNQFDAKDIISSGVSLNLQTDQYPNDDLFFTDILKKDISKIVDDSLNITDILLLTSLKSFVDNNMTFTDVFDIYRMIPAFDSINIIDSANLLFNKVLPDDSISFLDTISTALNNYITTQFSFRFITEDGNNLITETP